MLRVIPTWIVFGCCFATLARTTQAKDEPAEAPTPAVQTRDGVTVRIEKVSFERILNGTGWLRKEFGSEWRRSVPPGFHTDSFRVARIFVSVNGGVVETNSFAFGKRTSRVTRMSGSAEFDPPLWERQLPHIEVDKAAKGHIYWAVIERDAKVDAVFPATVKLDVITEDGKKSKFVFDNLDLKNES